MPRSGIVGVICWLCFLVFKGTTILFSMVPMSVYIPTNSAARFPCLHTLFRIGRLFDDGHSDWYEVNTSL